MKQRFAVSIVFAAVVMLAGSPLVAQEKAADHHPPTQAQMDEMTKKWQEAMTPGAPHKLLESMAGDWASETKVWMEGPDAPPMVTKGSSTMKMVLGGRFLLQDMDGEMMGMPMKGIGYTGYDNFKKKFVGFWIDDAGTGMYTMEGVANGDNTVLTFMGTMDDVMTGEKNKPVKYVTRILGKDKHIFEIHDMTKKGKDTKVMEAVYERKK